MGQSGLVCREIARHKFRIDKYIYKFDFQKVKLFKKIHKKFNLSEVFIWIFSKYRLVFGNDKGIIFFPKLKNYFWQIVWE